MSPSTEPAPPRGIRPKAALAFLAAAIAVGTGLVVATVGWYLTVSSTSGHAEGAKVRIRLSSACDAEARPVLLSRLTDYGLPVEPADSLAFDVTLPGRMPDEATHVPEALVAPGRLEVSVDGQPKDVKIDHVGMQLAFSGTPITLVMVSEPLPEQGVTAKIDGQEVEVEEVTGEELQIASRAAKSDLALRTASDRAVQLRHPLPCPVKVEGVDPLPP